MVSSVEGTPKDSGKSEQERIISETESTRQRIQTETENVIDEDRKVAKPKMPALIRILSILHIALVSVCLVATVHFYNEYISKKQEDVEFDKEAGLELGKMVCSVMIAGLISLSRAYLVQRYE